MFVPHPRKNAHGVLALACVLLLGLLVSGIASAPAATDTTRCGDKSIDRGAPDPTGGDPQIVVVGFNTPTEGDDVIFGTNGANTINGRGGDDVICGFDGRDTIRGGSGNDTVFAGLGNDELNGDDGDDVLNGEDDGDGIDGGLGNDTIFGQSSNDTLTGGGGDDIVFGGDNDDTLDGGDGNDQLTSEGGDDTLLGAAGDDELAGGDGNDNLQAGDGIDVLSGGNGADTIRSGPGEDKAAGGAGNDDVDGGDGLDDLAGEGGDDQVTGGAGDDSVSGGEGNDRLEGGDGNDALAGLSGDDTLLGSDGDDALFGGEGSDRLVGGNGIDALSGGDGIDLADYSGTLGAILLDLGTGEVTGGAGPDTTAGIENVDATPFDDELTGNDGDNVISGGAGDDTIDGGAGNDTENGDDGNDTFSQSGELRNGADTMSGGNGTLDTVDYTSRGNPVTSTNNGVADDGEAGEGDNVLPDVEGANLRPILTPAAPATPDLTTPALSNFHANASRFSPNEDKRLDEFTVTGRFSETTQWTFEILSGASVVFTDTGQGVTLKASWNGLTAEGRNAVSGTYRWRITGKDAAGNLLPARTGTVTVDRSHPTVRSVRVSPRRLSLRSGRSVQIRFRVGEASKFRVKIRRGSFLRSFGPRTLDDPETVALRWNGKTRRGKLAKPGLYRVEIGVRDVAGNLTVERRTIRVTF